MKHYLEKLLALENLTLDESYQLMLRIMSGKLNDAQISGLLIALRMKGESVDEITGFAEAMREKMIKLDLGFPAIDMCGTGGDGVGTFNISTCASFIVAGAGVKVAKHGNRAISSNSGSADVLNELGIDINRTTEESLRDIEEGGLGFLFAPNYHPAIKYAMNTRNSLGIRTVFNILGPLANPALVKYQAMGIFNTKLIYNQTKVLKNLGLEQAMVFSGLDGLDEITTTSETNISFFLNSTEIESKTISPSDFGIKKSKSKELLGGVPKENAQIIYSILNGDMGPKRDIAVLNAAAGIFIAGKCSSFQEGIILANESLDSGKALKVLKRITK